MKPGRTRNKRLTSRNWNRRSLWVAAPKSLVHVEYEKRPENYLSAQSTFKLKKRKDEAGGVGLVSIYACIHLFLSLSLTLSVCINKNLYLAYRGICRFREFVLLLIVKAQELHTYTHIQIYIYIHLYIYIYRHIHTWQIVEHVVLDISGKTYIPDIWWNMPSRIVRPPPHR